MKVVVTGSEGYIGAVLLPLLREHGHEVTAVDAGLYRGRPLYVDGAEDHPWIRRDVRRVTVDELRGHDAVVHMAELSNDPLGQLNQELTYAINHRGSVQLARRCREAGVPRFVYTSSCSVYGVGADGLRTETSELCPQTAYAECKVLVERDVAALAGDDFSPTFLRNATAFGPSPRMRFDIVLNNLAGLAWTTRELRLTSDGTPWRPLVHVRDIAEAIACALEAPRERVHGEIFNVGHTAQNYRIREIAEIVAGAFPGCGLSIGSSDGDTRSYRVSFDKIHAELPGFACRHDAEAGARQLRAIFESVPLTRELFEAPDYTRLKQLQALMSARAVDDELFWRAA